MIVEVNGQLVLKCELGELFWLAVFRLELDISLVLCFELDERHYSLIV